MTGTRIGQQQQSATIQDLATKVQKLTSPGPAFTNPVSLFTLTLGTGSSVQIAFRCRQPRGEVKSVQIYRGATRDFGTAIQLASYPAENLGSKKVNYTDTDASLSGTSPWYWLQIVPTNAANGSIEHGPQQITVP